MKEKHVGDISEVFVIAMAITMEIERILPGV